MMPACIELTVPHALNMRGAGTRPCLMSDLLSDA